MSFFGGGGGGKKAPEGAGAKALEVAKESESKSSSSSKSVHGFDPSALERAAKAAQCWDKATKSKEAWREITSQGRKKKREKWRSRGEREQKTKEILKETKDFSKDDDDDGIINDDKTDDDESRRRQEQQRLFKFVPRERTHPRPERWIPLPGENHRHETFRRWKLRGAHSLPRVEQKIRRVGGRERNVQENERRKYERTEKVTRGR